MRRMERNRGGANQERRDQKLPPFFFSVAARMQANELGRQPDNAADVLASRLEDNLAPRRVSCRMGGQHTRIGERRFIANNFAARRAPKNPIAHSATLTHSQHSTNFTGNSQPS